MNWLNEGVCAPKGFTANGIHCGIRKNRDKKDLALIVSEVPCQAAAVYTTNLVKGAPILVTRKHLADGVAQAMVCNSGNANTCNRNGEEVAEIMCDIVSAHTGIPSENIIVASTGVIGEELDPAPIASHMEELVSGLGNNSFAAEQAIMTTDTVEKMLAVSFEIGGKTCHLGGIAKGSGMIHPNMATMLIFLTTDTAISSAMLHKAIYEDCQDTFNMITVDGDTSTNDMLSIMANGLAGNPLIDSENEDYKAFVCALHAITENLSRSIAKDGEGATRLITCTIDGAKDKASARGLARSVIHSSLVKAAMFGKDANWGRIMCAMGYSGCSFDIHAVDISYVSAAGTIQVCKGGFSCPFDEDLALKILDEDEVTIQITLQDGNASAVAWGCDLTYDYVKINGDYRT
ncbi:MAG: bifunctional glutamate N-acetyltransferase/amino-acid acetyltransferase ArgJ [Clostridia bacterium]|nr:bifunctional glutamate N-acetyltransferase/amino-acid acetyltransferase ArgJ [Clostridia bacterium]